jgi:hypothetical protein
MSAHDFVLLAPLFRKNSTMNLWFRALRAENSAQSADTFREKVPALANVRALVSPAQLIILCLGPQRQPATFTDASQSLDELIDFNF